MVVENLYEIDIKIVVKFLTKKIFNMLSGYIVYRVRQ